MTKETDPQEKGPGKFRPAEAWEILIRTKAYKKYGRKHRKVVASCLRDLEELEKDRSIAFYDLDYYLKKGFLLTPQGEEISRRLGLYPLERSSVQVISYERAKITIQGGGKYVDITPWMREGRYLRLEFDLHAGVPELLKKVEFEIRRAKRAKKFFGQPWPLSTRGHAELKAEEIAERFKIFDLVEHFKNQGENDNQSVVKATKQYFTLEHPHPDDSRYKAVRRWHQRIKEELERVESNLPTD